jgi:hypothetical protein
MELSSMEEFSIRFLLNNKTNKFMKTLFTNVSTRIKDFVKLKFRYLRYLLPLLLSFATISSTNASTILGRSPVCVNDTANYYIGLPTSGLTYLWGPVSAHGIPSGTGTSVLNVLWIANGTGTITAYGVDGAGDTIETLNKNVIIKQPSIPHISTNYRVACQELAGETGGQPRPPGILDTSKCLKVCSGATVTYYGHGDSGSILTWSAVGASAIYPMGDSCIVVWGSPGIGKLTVTETNLMGCKGSATYCFEIIEKPLAHFETYAIFTDNDNSTSNAIGICLDDYVIFKDISTGSATSPIMSCYWDFGDGKYTTTASPTSTIHQYKTAGTYTAMLVVKNACGCSDTARIRIEVKPERGMYITCPSVVCEGAIAGYKVHDYVSCTRFNWRVIGGTIISTGPLTDTITVRWDNVDETGFGYVMFDGTDCRADCNGSAIIKIPVIQNRGKISGPKVICVGQPAMYRMPMWPTTKFNWNEASGTITLDPTDQWNEIVITASVPGTYVLRVNYRNTMLGCGGVAYDTITVLDKLDVLETGKHCEGTNYTWALSNIAATGDWTLIRPDGSTTGLTASNSFTSLLTMAGSYRLAVTGAFCGIDTIRFVVTPKPPAVDSLLGPERACPDVPTKYEAKNILAGYTFGWAADLGVVSPPTSNITWAKFSGTGPWQIKVWRTDALGCPSDTLRRTIISPIVPVTISGPTEVCGSSRHDYEVDYLDGETYDWEVWDNTYSTHYIGSVTLPTDSSHIGITWNNPSGTTELAHIIVKVRKCGVLMIDTIDVLVYTAPSLSISGPASVCSGSSALFTATASPAITSAISYTWDWGDLSVAGSGYPSESHIYRTLGATSSTSYTVTLTVVAPNGCSSIVSANTNITVDPQPILVVGDVNGDPLNHCGSSTWTNLLGPLAGSSTGLTYVWTKAGVGTLGTTANLAIDQTLWGTGGYTLTGTDPTTGCSTSTTIFITDSCNPCSTTTMPTVSLSAALTSCAHISATGSWTPSGWGFNPYWTYIEADPADVYNVSTTSTTFDADYRTAGVKKVTYTVKYLSGTDTCETKSTATVIVPFVANLTKGFYCVGGTSHVLRVFDISTTYASSPTRTFYVDGVYHSTTTASGTSFDVSGLTPGSAHTASLVMTAPGLPTCSTSISFTIPNTVVASFTIPQYNPACIEDAVVEFTNTSPGAPPLWRAHWDYGDLSDNDLWEPWKIYADITSLGNRIVTLTVADIYGCYDSVTDTVLVVDNDLHGYLNPSTSLACSGSPITLTYDPTPGPGMPTQFIWYESISKLAENTSSTRVVYEPGAYWVWGRDAYGCSDKTPTTIVDFNTVPEAIITGDTSVCEGSTYRLFYPAAAYNPTATYTWLENGVPFISGSTPHYDFSNSAGTYTYRLVISVTVSGVTCTDTSDPITVIVHPYPGTPVPSFNILSCDEYKVELSATSSSVGTFNWSSGDVGTPVLVYTGGPYRVWITDAYGCTAYNDIIVPHKPDVYQYVFPVGCYELCLNETPFDLLGPKAPASFDSWEWLMNGASSASGTGVVTTYSVTSPGTYNLVLENTPCRDTSGDLNISFKDCPDGCFGGLQLIGVTQTMAGGGMCYDTVELGIGCAPSVTYTIYCDNGTLLPATGTGPSPSKKFRYIADPGFTGPLDFITAIFYDPITGQSCRAKIPLPIGIPCPNSMAKRTQDTSITGGNLIANDLARLLLVPNPAQNSVRIEFGFTGKSSQRSIEVYDMAGRRMLSQAVQESYGTAILNLDGFSSGLYQVILRQDGNVFLHSKLSVVK